MSARILGLLLALFSLGCMAPPTEIVVFMTSELEVPGVIDRAVIIADADALGGGGGVHRSRISLEPGVPASLGVVQRADEATDILIRVEGYLGEDLVAHTARQVTFVPGRVMRLDITLPRICAIGPCGPAQSCTDQGVCGAHPLGTLRDYEN